MRTALTSTILALATAAATVAFAQVSDDMSCEEAQSYFAQHGMIETRENDQVIPIDEGVPEARSGELECENRGDVSMPVIVKTSDAEQCVISYACED